jgi:hypothetical protein
MAHVPFGMEALTIEGGDAAGFLAAVLQGVQAQRGDGGSLRRVIDAEDSALEAELVVVGVPLVIGVLGGWRGQRDFSTASSRPLRPG